MIRAAFALAALTAATLALAQQTSPQSPPDPQTTTPQEQTAPPSTSRQAPDSSRQLSETDKQTLMKNCMKQVQSDNPGASQTDVQAYCDKAVKSYSTPTN